MYSFMMSVGKCGIEILQCTMNTYITSVSSLENTFTQHYADLSTHHVDG